MWARRKDSRQPSCRTGTVQQQASAAGSPGNQGPGDISLDFADTDIREVVAQILGTILQGQLHDRPGGARHGDAAHATPLTRAQLLPALQALLARTAPPWCNRSAVPRRAERSAAAGAAAAGTAGAEPVPLRYASAEDLAKVLQPFVGAAARSPPIPAATRCWSAATRRRARR